MPAALSKKSTKLSKANNKPSKSVKKEQPLPKTWKRLIAQYKPYLMALYPVPKNISARSAASWWNKKARKDDFTWNGLVPSPKIIRPDIKSAIEQQTTRIPITTAVKQFVPNESKSLVVMRATIYRGSISEDPEDIKHNQKIAKILKSHDYDRINKIKQTELDKFTISIRSDEDLAMLRRLLKLNISWYRKYYAALDSWRNVNTPLGDFEAQTFAIKYRTTRKEKHPYMIMNEELDTIYNWLKDISANEINLRYRGSDGGDDIIVFPEVSYATIRGDNFIRAGPAYNSSGENCVIAAIRQALGESSNDCDDMLNYLAKKYQHGVWATDYNNIAQKLKIRLSVSYSPDSALARMYSEENDYKQLPPVEYYGSIKHRKIDLHHWNSHATAMLKYNTKEYHYVSEDEMKQLLRDHYEDIHTTSEYSITLRSRTDGVLDVYQLREADGIQLNLGKPTPQSTLFNDFIKQFAAYPYNDPNRCAYDTFCTHGIHYSNGHELPDDIDIDLKCAYSNYYKFPQYKGLPRDITYWVRNPTLDDVRSNIGNVLATFIEPLTDCSCCMWITTEMACWLINNGYLEEDGMAQGAFAHCTFDLDLSKFIDLDPIDPENPAINKRVFHRIIGLSTRLVHRKRYITSDPIELGDKPSGTAMYLPTFIDKNDFATELSGKHTVMVNTPSTYDRYLHVAATIHGLVVVQLWEKNKLIMAKNPNAKLASALVDGLRYNRKGIEDMSCFEDSLWVQKPIKAHSTKIQFDWIEHECVDAVILADKLIRVDCPIRPIAKYSEFLDVKTCDTLSMNDLISEGYIHSIHGLAGTGKSYHIRELLEQFNAIILTPTHATREEMGEYSIREYIQDYEDKSLNTIPVKTYQSVIQRQTMLNDYNVIIVDEAGMLQTEHANRIVEIAQRKLILFVGDPAQHSPVACSPHRLMAKQLNFFEYINSNESIATKIANESEWIRHQQLSNLHYDCTFDASKYDTLSMTAEEKYNHIEKLRAQFIETEKLHTSIIETGIAYAFGNIDTPYTTPFFDTYCPSLFLTDIKRVDDSEDGRALAQLCNDVRSIGVKAINDFCAKNPQYLITDNTLIESLRTDDTVSIAFRNADIDSHNNDVLSNNTIDPVIVAELKAIITDTSSTDIEREAARIKLDYAYPDIDIPITARETFSYGSDTIYNGTIGFVRNFVMKFGDIEIPICEIRTPTKRTRHNPFKRATLFHPKIQCMYSITSYRSQGRTLTNDTIIVDCTVYNPQMLYVAISRAKRLSQLKFYLGDKQRQLKLSKVEMVKIATENIKTSIPVSDSKCIFVEKGMDHEGSRLYADYTTFNWCSIFDKLHNQYNQKVQKFNEQQSKWTEIDYAMQAIVVAIAIGIENANDDNVRSTILMDLDAIKSIISTYGYTAKHYIAKTGFNGLIPKPDLYELGVNMMRKAIDEHIGIKNENVINTCDYEFVNPILAQRIRSAIKSFSDDELVRLLDSADVEIDTFRRDIANRVGRSDRKFNNSSLGSAYIYRTVRQRSKPTNIFADVAEVEQNMIDADNYTEPVKSVEPTKPVKKLTIAQTNAIFAPIERWATKHIDGTFEHSWRMIDSDTDKYVHPIGSNTHIVRVEKDSARRFYWIGSEANTIAFSKFIGDEYQGECHEVILAKSKLFLDVDLKLDYAQKHELVESMNMELFEDNEACTMGIVSKHIAKTYFDSLELSLSNAGNDLDIDWAYSLRNRPIENGGYKISIHLLTNIFVPVNVCASIVADAKQLIIDSPEDLGIDESIAGLLAEAIDTMPYHKHGSLAMLGGCKQGFDGKLYRSIAEKHFRYPQTNWLITEQDMFSITQKDLTLDAYNVIAPKTYGDSSLDQEFVKRALAHAHLIDSGAFDWDRARGKGIILRPRRVHSSHCSACNRVHDSDNTLSAIFDAERGFASWKCTHDVNSKYSVFYQE